MGTLEKMQAAGLADAEGEVTTPAELEPELVLDGDETQEAVVAEGEVRAYDMLRLTGGPDVLSKGAASTTEITDAIIARLL